MFAYEKLKPKQESKSTVQKKEVKKPVASPNLTGIPDGMKSQFENLSGFSFDDVRAHYNSDKPAKLQALAYTQGNQVYVGAGQEKHLGYELGHVVQQKQGRVKPTIQLQGIHANDDAVLERETDGFLRGQSGQGVIQRYVSVLKHELTDDFVENTSIDYAVKRAGNPIVLFDSSDFSGLTEENFIYFVGHGRPGKAGDIPTGLITNKLCTDSATKLTKPVAGIVFTSCNAGTDISTSHNEGNLVITEIDSSVVDEVSKAINAMGFTKKIPVRGATGPSIKSHETGNDFYVVDSTKKTSDEKTAGDLQRSEERLFLLKLKSNKGGIIEYLKNKLKIAGFDMLLGNIDRAVSECDVDGGINQFIRKSLEGTALSVELKASFIATLTAPFFRSFVNNLIETGMLKPAEIAMKNK